MLNAESNNMFELWNQQNEAVLSEQFPIHRACRDGDVESLSLLLQSKGEQATVVEDSYYGWSPAHWAAYFGKLDCLRRLIHIHQHANLRSSRFDQTPAHIAAFGGHPLCLQWLLQLGADPNQKDYLGETPLHKATRTKSVECINLLVSHGAKLEICNNNGLSPFELAMNCGFQQTAEHLRIIQEQKLNELVNCVLNPGANSVQENGHVNGDTHMVEKNGSVTTNGFHVSNGYYGYHPHLTKQTDDCEMETTDSHMEVKLKENASPVTDGCYTNGHSVQLNGTVTALINNNSLPARMPKYPVNGDVLLHNGVSINNVPAAGRKRLRDECSSGGIKRTRQEDLELMREQCWVRLTGQAELQSLENFAAACQGLQSNLQLRGINERPPVTTSMMEHRNSMSMEQGYDSMFMYSLLASCHGS